MMFTMQEPYYGIILSSMERMPDKKLNTMGVTRSGNVFRLLYNPDFVNKLDVPTTLELLKHEVMHIAFNHFSIWKDEYPPKDIQKVRNVAADLEVNCYLNRNNVHGITIMHPSMFKWETELGTREYFKRLMEKAKEQQQQQKASKNVSVPCNGGKGGDDEEEEEEENDNGNNNDEIRIENPSKEKDNEEMDEENEENNEENDEEDGQDEEKEQVFSDDLSSGKNEQETELPEEFLNRLEELDDHSMWPDKEEEESTSQIIEDMLLQAAEEVEKSGYGTIPNELNSKIAEIKNRRKPRPVADWKRYVRRYLGNEFSEFIRKSKKRESRRFPDAAGNRHRRKSHILVAVDTSGSVSIPEYLEFFGQIRTLTSIASFQVVECDAMIQKIYEFRDKPNMDFHGGGGTSFEPVIDYFLERRKIFDALIYFTDGECWVPDNTPKETLWVISSRGDKNRANDFKKNGANVVFIPKGTV